MGKTALVLVAAAAMVMFAGCDTGSGGAGKRVKVSEESDNRALAAYMLGRDIGNTLKDMDADLDLNALYAAISEVLSDVPSQLSDSMLRAVDQQFRVDLQARREEKRAKKAEENKAAGEAFLAANRQNPGVIVTESGLQYIVIKEGDGDAPALSDRVSVHYEGTLIDGKEFDSSIKRGAPATFPLTGVIRGWTEALQLMKVGGKIKIFVPSELGYGERGMPPAIEPNSALVFEIELLSIEK